MKRTAQLLAGVALLAGCGGERIPTESTAQLQPQVAASHQQSGGGEDADDDRGRDRVIRRDLETLRRVTAPFHKFEKAVAAGWGTKITACMSDPTLGGMGFHYGNTAFIDGIGRVDQPELLLYEPAKNGRLSLVAVEYIIPYTFHARDAAPPKLFGQKYTQNDTFQLWGLHVWVWKENPSGLFASWNPRVSCKNTTDVMSMARN